MPANDVTESGTGLLDVEVTSDEVVAALRDVSESQWTSFLQQFLRAHESARTDPKKVLRRLLKIAQRAFEWGLPDIGRAALDVTWQYEASHPGLARPRRHLLLDHPDIRRRFADMTKAQNVIFITGCARSGTTLLLNCMATLHDVKYLADNTGERPLSTAVTDNTNNCANVVLKRTAKCHKFFTLIPDVVRILHIVRHPFDVITSRHPHEDRYYLDPQRWLDEYAAFRLLRERHPQDRLCIVRYEDLLLDPDAVQRRIADELKLEFDLPFSRYQERSHLDTRDVAASRRPWSPIEPQPGRSPQDRTRHANRVESFYQLCRSEIDAFCQDFDYRL